MDGSRLAVAPFTEFWNLLHLCCRRLDESSLSPLVTQIWPNSTEIDILGDEYVSVGPLKHLIVITSFGQVSVRAPGSTL